MLLYLRRRFFILILALGAAGLDRPARACSMTQPYRVPTNFELVRRADLVVLARVVSGATDLNGRDSWVTLEVVRVLKGTRPAEPLRLMGAIRWNGRAIPSMPTPLHASHFSAGLGACIRVFYSQDGLVVAMFEHGAEGFMPIWAAFARLAEDVEGPDGIWVRAAETYVATQRNVPDSGLRAAAEARMTALRAERDDLAAQAMADDLQDYLDATAPSPSALPRRPRWSWADTGDGVGAGLQGPTEGTGAGLRCERGQTALHLDLFGRAGTPALAFEIGGQRFAAQGVSRVTLPGGPEIASGTLPFSPDLVTVLRTSPAPARIIVDDRPLSVATPGDVLQKLAFRCAALLTPGTAAAGAR